MADDPEKLAEDTTLEQRMTDGGVFSSDGKVFWDGELLSLLQSAMRRYRSHFGRDPPAVDTLPPEQWEVALDLLNTAINRRSPSR